VSARRGIGVFSDVIRVLLAEDVALLRGALVALVELEDDLTVVAEVSTGDALVPAAMKHRPDVAVIDVDLPVMDGITAAALLHERLPGCRVLIVTGLARIGNLQRALAAHATGFVLKDIPPADLVKAIRRVAAGEQVIDMQLAVAALRHQRNPLTPREAQVLRLAADGAGPQEIAAELRLSVGTVRNYLGTIVEKLNARNRMDAIRIAVEMGWL
jgi:two-component system response regulator DesR